MLSRSPFLGWALVIALFVGGVPAKAEPDGLAELAQPRSEPRQAVPPKELLAAAAAEVKDAFGKKNGAAKTPESRIELAKSLLEVAAAEQKPPLRYVLLQQSQLLATDAGNLETSKLAFEQRAAQFQIDYDEEVVQMLEGLVAETGSSALPEVIDAIFDHADALCDKYEFQEATKIAQLAVTAARKTKTKDELNEAITYATRVKEKAKEFAAVKPAFDKLRQAPGDAEAALVAGKYLCFVADDWRRGLPLLARSNDPDLTAVSRADISRPAGGDPQASILIADRWFEWGKAQKGTDSAGAMSRAESIYAGVLDDASGLDKVRITNRVEEIRSALFGGGSRWTVIFRSAKPELWNTAVDNSTDFSLLLASLPATIRYVRVRNSAGQAVIMPISRDQLGRYSRVGNYAWQGGKPVIYGATTLGVVDLRNTDPGEPVLLHVENVGKPDATRYGGWGIGKTTALPGPVLEGSWAGAKAPLGPLEIAVTTGELSAGERKLLLK
jgi:hypothetical protein